MNYQFLFKGKQIQLKGKFQVGVTHAYFDYTDENGNQHQDTLTLGEAPSGMQ